MMELPLRSAQERPWIILFVLFIAFVPATASLFLYSFAILPTAKDWGLTPFGAAVAGFTPMALSPLGGILFGIVSDRYGRRNALLSSILLSASSALLSGLSVGPYDFGFYRLLLGVGIRGQWAVSMTLVGEVWPPDERGRAVATVQTSFPAGFIYASLIALGLAGGLSWRGLLMLGALPAALAAPLAYLCIKESSLWLKDVSKAAGQRVPYREILRGGLLRYTVLGTLIMFIGAFGAWAVNPWIPTYLATLGIPAQKVPLLTLLIMVGALIGYTVHGFISDRLGRKTTFQLFFLGMVVALGSFGFIPSQAWFVRGSGSLIPIVLMGGAVAFFLGYYSGYGSLLAELFPTRVRSRGMGFCYSVGGIGTALGPAGTGYLSSLLGTGRAFMIVSIIFLIGSILIRLLPETMGKKL
jgi:MFS family permease